MAGFHKLFLAGLLPVAIAAGAAAQDPVGDRDDQFVATGCVTAPGDVRTAGPHSILVWSKGDVYLSSPRVQLRPADAQPVGTVGDISPVFYWIDDEDDFARHVGQEVEIVGELSDELREGEIEFEHEGELTRIEFEVRDREATARIPTTWLGPSTRGRDVELDVVVRTVDVEKVTVLGPCGGR